MLAVCGGGGDNAVALAMVALAAALWALVAVIVIRAAPERRERKVLFVLTLVSSLAGPAIVFGLLDGFSGDNSRLPEIAITLLLPGLIYACVAVVRRTVYPAHALFIWLWGSIFFVGIYAVLVVAAIAGGACAD